MTGYGGAEDQINGVTYIVEVKSVNNRYFKTNVRLPDATAFLEEEIEKLLRKNLLRGTVTYTLRLRNVSANVLFEIDEEALKTYAGKLEKVASSVDANYQIDLANLLNLPAILIPVTPDEKSAEQIRTKVLDITQQAIDGLKQMRKTEGAALAADLDKNCMETKQYLEKIGTRSGTVLNDYHEKLKKRVDALLASSKIKLDEEMLAREVAIFAERSDISEEISRLDSHLNQLAQCGQSNGQAGRKLDFIGQEMLREANTIASKASDAEMGQWVVEIKCRIDRIKEQVQNVE